MYRWSVNRTNGEIASRKRSRSESALSIVQIVVRSDLQETPPQAVAFEDANPHSQHSAGERPQTERKMNWQNRGGAGWLVQDVHWRRTDCPVSDSDEGQPVETSKELWREQDDEM